VLGPIETKVGSVAATSVTIAVAVWLESNTEVAVTVTIFEEGKELGAV
jgi:hypothetical protein